MIIKVFKPLKDLWLKLSFLSDVLVYNAIQFDGLPLYPKLIFNCPCGARGANAPNGGHGIHVRPSVPNMGGTFVCMTRPKPLHIFAHTWCQSIVQSL